MSAHLLLFLVFVLLLLCELLSFLVVAVIIV